MNRSSSFFRNSSQKPFAQAIALSLFLVGSVLVGTFIIFRDAREAVALAWKAQKKTATQAHHRQAEILRVAWAAKKSETRALAKLKMSQHEQNAMSQQTRQEIHLLEVKNQELKRALQREKEINQNLQQKLEKISASPSPS